MRQQAASSIRYNSCLSLLIRIGDFIFKWRDLLFPIVLLGIGFGTKPRMAGASVRVDHAVDVLGFVVSLAGQALRVVVIGLDYITRGGQDRRIWANALVNGGVFAHCRNPLYLGNFLILAGLTIVHGGWAMYLVAMPFFGFAYSAVVIAEEQYLQRRFGDAYTQYCTRVPRWIPSVNHLRDTMRGARLDWLKVLRKEYGTVFAWVSGFLALLIWEHVAFSDALPRVEFQVIGVMWVVLTVAYAVTRTLKLRGKLGHT